MGRNLAILIISTLITTLIACIYAVVHNLITYSISDEYFSRYTFEQFGLWEAPASQHPWMAAYMGMVASWWFGALSGLIISGYVLFLSQLPKPISMIRKGVITAMVITFAFSFVGYGVGVLFINDMGMDLSFINSLEDSKAFVTAGSIHNFTYLGAIIGLVGSLLYLVYRSRGIRHSILKKTSYL